MDDSDTADEVGLRAAFERLEFMIRRQDEATAGQFYDDAILIGPAPGERALGRPAITALLAEWLGRSYSMSWEWQRFDLGLSGNVGWLSADGSIVLSERGPDFRKPYRLTGVLQHDGQRWLWRLFDGVETSRS